jgi:Family of unknown function (DUF6519)
MKGDFSRKTFDATKHYSGVLMQQGRVQLDADWNEQLGIQRHRDYTEAEDVIGECGAPKHDAGFLVQPTPDGTDLVLSPGRFYVHGRLCELESTAVDAVFVSATEATVSQWHVDGADFAPNQWVELSAANAAATVVRVQATTPASRQLTLASSIAAFQNAAAFKIRRLTTYLTQPDLPNPPFSAQPNPALPPVLELPSGAFLIYVDVWPRHLTAFDDDLIREKALGGPDTATRVKTVWQVKLWPGPNDEGGPPDDTGCGLPVPGWDALTAPSTGRLAARTKPAPDTDNPCLLPPEAGYLGLENQLYRVEIHQGGVLGTDAITFKWSRDNGSVVKAIEKIAGTTDFTVHDTGPDDVLGLANGQWVEQMDDVVDLQGIARDLFQFAKDPVTGAVTLSFPVDEARHPQLRRWDSTDEVAVPFPPVGDGWIDLENGIQVGFEPGTYRTGDYWQIPARTVLGDIEWPRDGAGQPVSQLRRGIDHHYCRIGVLHVGDGTLTVEDCRPVFPPLTELKSTSSCCTFTVGDGTIHVGDFTLIQEAVNHLPAEGGQICIFPGTYAENVLVEGRTNVHIKGCGHRTRVVSAPPGPNGVAGPVFHLVSSERVRIEALSVEAAEAAPGILADGEKPNRRVTIERVGVKAAKDSAIKFRGGQDVAVESCHITMTDPNGGWPGIFLQADDALARDNVVEGTLVGLAPGRLFRLTGAAAVSGLQIGGGSERVRVHDNVFRGCSGQGITLGSMVVVGADGEPTGQGGGWVIDRNDPCFPCDDPTTGDRPPSEGDEPPTRLQSEGDLYDIDIRRDGVFGVGLDGIGTAHFFDLQVRQKALGFVRVQDLVIVDNRIERCVCRAFAPIPANMIDLMAYGGIALSWIEGLVIRDNRIEDVGWSGLLPVCGIFVLAVEGLEASRNHILNSGRVTSVTATTALPGRRGGIHVVYALPLLASAPPAASDPDAPAATSVALPIGGRRLGVAAIVEENSVDVIQGQALSLGALGPVSVVSNRFISRGLVARDVVAILRGQTVGLVNALTHLSTLVSIVNLGASGDALNWNTAVSTGATHGTAAVRGLGTAPGTVLFDDNVCSLALDPDRTTQGQGARLPPAILVFSLDDVGFQDNQCDCVVPTGTLPLANVLFGISVRAVSNRFKETPGRALYSAWTLGIMNMTAHNQANHCLLVTGTLLMQDQPNQVLNSAACPGARRSLAVQIRPLVEQ